MRLWPFGKSEKRSGEFTPQVDDVLLKALIGNTTITSKEALTIPAVSACVGIISDTVASLPILLYKSENKKVTEIKDDTRISLLNDETMDTLDGFQFKKALIVDYLLNGAGYAFINRHRNSIESLHFVEHTNVSIQKNTDPIFKDYDILVHGAMHRGFEFLKLTRKTTDGITGMGIIGENNKVFSVAYNSLVFEDMLVKTGGNKKGFLKALNRLSKEAIEELKLAWKNLYKNNDENVVILNNGMEFQEASNTSVEMQLNENKKTNSAEICKIFVVPESILDGTASDEVYNNWIKVCILPILIALQTALNKDLLLPSEKGSFYFVFDTKELLKGDIEKRFKAYEIAIKNKILGINEIRYQEDKEPIEAFEDLIVLGLNDVLYNMKTGAVYTPNTDKSTNMNDNKNKLEGGDEDENRNPGESGIT